VIKQFVPSEYCLKCQGCCRFREENSVWAPCLFDEELLNFVDKEGIPAVSIGLDKRIHPVFNPKGEGFICPFLNLEDNKCKAYSLRPFECQLYPFLLNLRAKKILLTVDLNCPYAKEKMHSQEFKDYIEYLNSYLNTPAQIRHLKDNPQVLCAYEEVLEVIELSTLDETP
jgi:hypothetical protein